MSSAFFFRVAFIFGAGLFPFAAMAQEGNAFGIPGADSHFSWANHSIDFGKSHQIEVWMETSRLSPIFLFFCDALPVSQATSFFYQGSVAPSAFCNAQSALVLDSLPVLSSSASFLYAERRPNLGVLRRSFLISSAENGNDCPT